VYIFSIFVHAHKQACIFKYMHILEYACLFVCMYKYRKNIHKHTDSKEVEEGMMHMPRLTQDAV